MGHVTDKLLKDHDASFPTGDLNNFMATAAWGPWKHLEACSLLCSFPKYLLLQKQHPATGAEGRSLGTHATGSECADRVPRGPARRWPGLAALSPEQGSVCGKLVFACRQQLQGPCLGLDVPCSVGAKQLPP